MNCDDILDKYVVRIDSQSGIGSGFIFYYANEGIYIITAEHCLCQDPSLEKRNEFNLNELTVAYKRNTSDKEFIKLKPCKVIYSDNIKDDLCIIKIPNEELFKNSLSFNEPIPIRFLNKRFNNKEYFFRGYPNSTKSKEAITLKGNDNHIPDNNIRFELNIEYLDKSTSGEPVYNFFKGFSGSGVFIKENGNLYLVGIQKALPSPDGDFNLIICHGIENLKQLMQKELVSINYSFLPDFDFISNENLNYINIPPKGIKLPDGTKINNSTDYIYDRPELKNISTLIESHQKLIFVTGEAGSGKSSVLNSLFDQLIKNHYVLFIQCRKYIFINNLESFIKEIYHHCENENDFFLQMKRVTQKLIVIIDSLDVISWDHIKLKAFIEFIEKLRQSNNISIIISCRTFDLNYNADLKIYEPQSKRINIGNIPTPEIEKIFLLLNINLPFDLNKRELILTFFSLPIRLHILFQVYNQISDIHDISNDLKLNEALWNKLTQNIAGINYDFIEKQVFTLIKMMFEEERFDINYNNFRNENNFNADINAILISNGLLKKSDDEVSITFFHQTFFDYVAVRYLYASNKNVLTFISENQEKYFFLPTIRYYLNFLRSRDTNYFNNINSIIEKEDYDVVIKLNFVRFIAELKEPNQNEIQIILDLLQKEIYDRAFFRLANENWFFVLYNKNKFVNLTKNQIYSFLLYANRIDFEDENIFIQTINVLITFKLENYEQYELIKLVNKLSFENVNVVFKKISTVINTDNRRYNKEWLSIINKVYSKFPEIVLITILENFKKDHQLENEEKEIIKKILSVFPNNVTLVIDFFENYEQKERKRRKTYFSNEHQEDIELENDKENNSFYIHDTCCVWNYDRKTFCFDLGHGVDILIYLIDVTLNKLATTDLLKYQILFDEILKSNYESINRIAFLSAVNHNQKSLYLPFLLNQKSYYSSTIVYYIKENLSIFWNQLSSQEKDNLCKIILEYYQETYNKLPLEKRYLASCFLLEFKYSFKNLKYPELLEKPFAEADMIYRNHLTSNNIKFTEEGFQAALQPRLGGIGDVQIEKDSSFSVHELEKSGDEEKISLLKNYLEKNKPSNLAYWWVEDGRRLTEGFSKNPREYLSIVNTILEDDKLFRFRNFLMRGIGEYEKQVKENSPNLKSKLTQEEIAELSLRIISENYFDEKDFDVVSPEIEFVRWVSDYYEEVPIHYKKLIRDKVVKIFQENQKKYILNYDNKHLNFLKPILKRFPFFILRKFTFLNSNPIDYKEDYLTKALNSTTGVALEAISKIIYYEIKSNKEKLIFIKEGKSLNFSHRVIVGLSIQNLKKHFPKDCLRLINYWTNKKDILSLKYGIQYFYYYQESEIPVILKYIEKWLPFFEIEIQIYKNLHEHSFTSNCINLIIHLASRGIAKAKLILSNLIKSKEDFSNKYKHLIISCLMESLIGNTDRDQHLLPLLFELSKLEDSKIRGEFIFRICNVKQEFISDNDRRKLILEAFQIDIVSKDLVPYSLRQVIKELYKENYSWMVELCKEIFLNRKLPNMAPYELESFGDVLVDIYLKDPERRHEVSKLINVLIISGWEKGLNDIYGLGR